MGKRAENKLKREVDKKNLLLKEKTLFLANVVDDVCKNCEYNKTVDEFESDYDKKQIRQTCLLKFRNDYCRCVDLFNSKILGYSVLKGEKLVWDVGLSVCGGCPCYALINLTQDIA